MQVLKLRLDSVEPKNQIARMLHLGSCRLADVTALLMPNSPVYGAEAVGHATISRHNHTPNVIHHQPPLHQLLKGTAVSGNGCKRSRLDCEIACHLAVASVFFFIVTDL